MTFMDIKWASEPLKSVGYLYRRSLILSNIVVGKWLMNSLQMNFMPLIIK
jgi:hypothetical protein